LDFSCAPEGPTAPNAARPPQPAGTIRVTAGEHAAIAILWLVLPRLLPGYPDINVEIIVDYGLTDIVAERYDAVSPSANRWRKTWLRCAMDA
jgi:DNA-binding transcriptional LysR family regulator